MPDEVRVTHTNNFFGVVLYDARTKLCPHNFFGAELIAYNTTTIPGSCPYPKFSGFRLISRALITSFFFPVSYVVGNMAAIHMISLSFE